jgi:hypothetical protein
MVSMPVSIRLSAAYWAPMASAKTRTSLRPDWCAPVGLLRG